MENLSPLTTVSTLNAGQGSSIAGYQFSEIVRRPWWAFISRRRLMEAGRCNVHATDGIRHLAKYLDTPGSVYHLRTIKNLKALLLPARGKTYDFNTNKLAALPCRRFVVSRELKVRIQYWLWPSFWNGVWCKPNLQKFLGARLAYIGDR